ncbi:MAG: bifunctional UDP-N-acetylglucosamine diphosphorylase/glucosamine-1-phosphate N-acetyltransferase GlmU [Elusimicrobiota bacterium]|jgi:bifunctional UDP-N-acetylglucosamine pyrophosphorylase/glucosamine-1-phosphate N-acetyltransferase|nr:bifunctional UDP-N-acetylglucosamine diphosphorylase/glucosamine-1-phosphate N-acetyltransferase GlmU [Elusimicrobiota bacterium]
MVAKKNLCALILAGGKGTRMKSDLPKPLHKISGAAILAHILKTAQKLNPSEIGVVVGHRAELLKETVLENASLWGIKTPVDFILQKELTGSGTAVKYAANFLKKHSQVLILAGDAPLIKANTLKQLIKTHNQAKAACTVFTVDIDNPKGYGRIVRDNKGHFSAIVEESETDAKTSAIKEVNSGMYIFETAKLLAALAKLRPQGPKKEYYLTDTLALLKQSGQKVEVFKAQDSREAMGINSKKQLAQAGEIMRQEINNALMDSGVTIINPQNTYIDASVKIGADTIIYPNCFISGKTTIAAGCIIGPNCWIEDSVLDTACRLKSSCYITGAKLAKGCQIGPFAHLRPATILKEGVKVGNFTEIKKSVIGKGTKVSHLSYVGDSDFGADVNVGAGTITCNYDGVNKYKTVVKDGVFVGSNTNFVAPVVIGAGAKIGAGSTITQDIPAGSLAIARARQVNMKKKENKK